MQNTKEARKEQKVPKKADLTTILCFIRPKRIEYTPKDMHEIGKVIADKFREMYNREPTTVQQCEGRQVIVVNAYPYEFSKHISKAVSDHFKSRK